MFTNKCVCFILSLFLLNISASYTVYGAAMGTATMIDRPPSVALPSKHPFRMSAVPQALLRPSGDTTNLSPGYKEKVEAIFTSGSLHHNMEEQSDLGSCYGRSADSLFNPPSVRPQLLLDSAHYYLNALQLGHGESLINLISVLEALLEDQGAESFLTSLGGGTEEEIEEFVRTLSEYAAVQRGQE